MDWSDGESKPTNCSSFINKKHAKYASNAPSHIKRLGTPANCRDQLLISIIPSRLKNKHNRRDLIVIAVRTRHNLRTCARQIVMFGHAALLCGACMRLSASYTTVILNARVRVVSHASCKTRASYLRMMCIFITPKIVCCCRVLYADVVHIINF